jgi:hypothetical protein
MYGRMAANIGRALLERKAMTHIFLAIPAAATSGLFMILYIMYGMRSSLILEGRIIEVRRLAGQGLRLMIKAGIFISMAGGTLHHSTGMILSVIFLKAGQAAILGPVVKIPARF